MTDTPPRPFVPYVPGPTLQATSNRPPAGPPFAHQQPAGPTSAWTAGHGPAQMPRPPASNNRGLLIVIAALLGLLVLGIGAVAVWYFFDGKGPVEAVKDVAGPQTYRITGTFTLADRYSGGGGGGCSGDGGFRDISQGTQVTVTDSAGATVALGLLGAGRIENGTCVFPFEVDGVPAGKDFYGIEVSHRGAVKYLEDEVKSGSLKLTLG